MEEEKEEVVVSEVKLKKLRNLKYFRDWDDEKIIQWVKLRENDKQVPPPSQDLVGALPASANPSDVVAQSIVKPYDDAEYKKKYTSLLTKFRKEYAVDMNETNDAEALKSLVNYVIQQETVNTLIMKEQNSASPDHRTLKGLGDFQRSIQMNVNELQDKLGISRKARKEKQHNDIPEYISSLQARAKEFWERKTVAVKCEKCKIELARYWLNFPDIVDSVSFNLTCDKCKSKVMYHVSDIR